MQHPWCGATCWTENWPDSWYLMIILPVNSLRMLDPAMQEYAHAANVLMTFTSGKPATNILRPLRGEMSVPWQTWMNMKKHMEINNMFNHPNPETRLDLKGLAFLLFSLHLLSICDSKRQLYTEPKPWTKYLLLIGVEGRQILKVWPRVWWFLWLVFRE